MLADGSLYIEKTSVTDSGSYTVKVSNAAGQSAETINVTVLQPLPPKGINITIMREIKLTNKCLLSVTCIVCNV